MSRADWSRSVDGTDYELMNTLVLPPTLMRSQHSIVRPRHAY